MIQIFSNSKNNFFYKCKYEMRNKNFFSRKSLEILSMHACIREHKIKILLACFEKIENTRIYKSKT